MSSEQIHQSIMFEYFEHHTDWWVERVASEQTREETNSWHAFEETRDSSEKISNFFGWGVSSSEQFMGQRFFDTDYKMAISVQYLMEG